MRRRTLSIFGALAGSLLVDFFCPPTLAFATGEGPQTLTVDGRMYSDSDHLVPALDPSINFTAYILDPTKNCILYSEQQTVSTQSSAGAGSAKRTGNDSGNPMASVFQNVSAIAGKLVSTGASCTYTPSTGDVFYKQYCKIL